MKIQQILSSVNEGVLDDVRARMAAGRDPAAAQPTAAPVANAGRFKVGDTVDFGVGVPRPKVIQQGTVTAIQGTGYTVKTADGQTHELDSRMKSLYLVPAQTATSASEQGMTEGAAKFDPKTGLPASGQISEFGGDATQFSTPTQSAPTTEQPPRRGYSIILTGNPGKDWMAEYAWQALEAVLPRDYPGDSIAANVTANKLPATRAMLKVVEVNKNGSAMIKSGINSEDIAETIVSNLVANRVPAQFWRITSEDLNESVSNDLHSLLKSAGIVQNK
jgi:hypothetical protein